MKALPTPYPDYDFIAYTIGWTGEIVCSGSNPISLPRALIWFTLTNVHDMNSLTVSSPMILEAAYGVNSLGQIVGVGKPKRTRQKSTHFWPHRQSKALILVQ